MGKLGLLIIFSTLVASTPAFSQEYYKNQIMPSDQDGGGSGGGGGAGCYTGDTSEVVVVQRTGEPVPNCLDQIDGKPADGSRSPAVINPLRGR